MKQLPHSIESERGLLGSILVEGNLINMSKLKEDDFYHYTNKKLYRIFQTLSKHKKSIDMIVTLDFIKCHGLEKEITMSDLVELSDEAQTYNFETYHKIIKEKSDRRKMILYAREIEKMGYEESQEMKEVMQNVEDISDHIFNLKEKEEVGDTISYVNAFEDIRDRTIQRNGMLGINTIHEKVDKYTKGFIEGKIYTLVAYSNVGKSKMSYAYISDFLKQGKKVMVLSLEVDKGMLFSNILASYYGKQYHEVMNSDFYYEMQDFENLEIYDDIYKLEDIKGLVKYKRPDIVVIDFIQNIQCSGNGETEKMTKVAQELQQLAINTGISFLNLSQANNDSRFKDGENIQPKGSGAIFASSDVIFALNRDGGNLCYTIAKNKYGKANIKFLCIPNETFSEFKLSEEIKEQNGFAL